MVAVILALFSSQPPEPIHVTPAPLHHRQGVLIIPSLHLRAPVVQGGSKEDLKRSVGHLPNSYLPGMGGDIDIFGHDVTPWRNLPHGPFYSIMNLRRGDEIIFKVPWGRYRYEVTGHHKVTVKPNQGWSHPDLNGEVLHLATCWPRYTSLQRWVVSAKLVR